MRIKTFVVGVLALLLFAAPMSAAASVGAAGSGLWPDDPAAFTGSTIDDNGAVELGVKFTTDNPVLITGVRIYRVDAGPVTGSLWKADGTLLTTGTFGSYAGSGWQDLVFSSPVSIVPGQTYIASYFAPNADYAYTHYYFTNDELTVGPITALASVQGDPNGVFCYADQSCFPTLSYRDSNYWVSPLWPSYDFDGFFQPVDNNTLNKAKAGSAIPVKFSLGGDLGLDVLTAGYPEATQIQCEPGEAVDTIEETVTAGASSLTYDAYADQYVYVWKTKKAWANKCFEFELGLNDGTSNTFEVRFFK